MKEKVSIIVPVYKTEQYKLERMLQSCLKQSYKNYELILIDDHDSNDYIGNYIDEVAKKYKNVDAYHQKNSGVSSARNLGLSKATGDWVCFVDADDWVEPDLLKNLVNECQKDIDMVACSCFVYKDGRKNKNVFLEKDSYVDYKSKDQILLQLLSKGISQHYPDFVAFGVPWAKLYRRSVLLEFCIIFPEEVDKYEDAIFIFNFLENCNKIRYVNIPLYNYDVHNQSLSHGFKKNIISITQKANLELKKIISKYNKDELFQQAYHIKVVMSINSYLKQYILHNDAKLNFLQKRKAIKNVIENQEYLDSLNKVKKDYLSNKEKMLYYFLKLRLYSALIVVYTFV